MAVPSASNKWMLKHELGNYLYFSPRTTGSTGRAVKIHADLFMPFFFAVNPSTYEGQSIIRTIEALSSTPSHCAPQIRYYSPTHAQRLTNINDTFQHTLMIKNVQIFYRIDQEDDDQSPVVYINNVRIINHDSLKAPGLYGKNRFNQVTKMKNNNIDGHFVYINSLSDSPRKAYETAEDRASIDDKDANSLALFYSPSSVANDLGTWNSPGQAHRTSLAVKELTEVFRQNIKSKQGTHWVVEGEGCALLSKALESIPGDLQNHTFKIINPITDTPKLLQNVNRRKGVLTGEFFDYSNSPVAYAALAAHKEALIKQIGLLPEAKNYDRITRKKISSQIDALSNIGKPLASQAVGLKTSKLAFTQALKKAGVYRK